MSDEKVVTKTGIAHSLAAALMRLGKSDWEGVLWNIDKAREQVAIHRRQNLERKTVETFLRDDYDPNFRRDMEHAAALREIEREERREPFGQGR
jgi:hypothetical protein